MSVCTVNKGKHAFHAMLAEPNTHVNGGDITFHVKTWHTCMSCGERRAITAWGELIVKVNREWEVRAP